MPSSKKKAKEDMLFAAIGAGNLAAVAKAVEEGARLDALNEFGRGPIQWAAMRGEAEILAWLIQRVDDAALRPRMDAGMERDQMSVLDLAVTGGKESCVLALIDSGRYGSGDPEFKANFLRAMALDQAKMAMAFAKSFDMAERGFAVEKTGGRTALEIAASMGKVRCVEALLAVSKANDPPGHFASALRLCAAQVWEGSGASRARDSIRAAMAREERADLEGGLPPPPSDATSGQAIRM